MRHPPDDEGRRALECFRELLPNWTKCTNGFDQGTYHKPISEAVNHLYLQPNLETFRYIAIILDIDKPNFHWNDCYGRRPTIIASNPIKPNAEPEPQRSHWIYLLKEPVLTGKNARIKPQVYLHNVAKAMKIQAQAAADQGYGRGLTKNPLHPHWHVDAWLKLYLLEELSESILPGTQEEMIRQSKLGDQAEGVSESPNPLIFNDVRLQMYQFARENLGEPNLETLIHNRTRELVAGAEAKFGVLLGPGERKATTKSIAGFCYRNAENFGKPKRKTKDDAELKERQSASANATNEKRKANTAKRIHKAITEIEADGKKVTVSEISRHTGITRYNIRKSGALKK